MADLERNKALTRRLWEEAWGGHRVDVGDEVFATEIQLHVMGRTLHGLDEMRANIEQWIACFPDLAARVDMQAAEGDLVCDHVVFSGTHTGAPFREIEPRGAAVSFTQTTFCRIDGERIAEIWEDVDFAGFMRQLGA